MHTSTHLPAHVYKHTHTKKWQWNTNTSIFDDAIFDDANKWQWNTKWQWSTNDLENGIQTHTISTSVWVSAASPSRTHISTHQRGGGCTYVQVPVSTYWYTCTSTSEGRRLSVSRVTGCGKPGSSPQVTSFSCTLGGNDNRSCVYM